MENVWDAFHLSVSGSVDKLPWAQPMTQFVTIRIHVKCMNTVSREGHWRLPEISLSNILCMWVFSSEELQSCATQRHFSPMDGMYNSVLMSYDEAEALLSPGDIARVTHRPVAMPE